MELNNRYRLVALLVAIGVLALVFLFLQLARQVGQTQVAWEDLPEPVRRVVRDQAGEAAVIVQIVRPRTPDAASYRVTLQYANGEQRHLWLTASGQPRRPAPASLGE